MSNLSRKIAGRREFIKEYEGITLRLRRPTHAEFLKFIDDKGNVELKFDDLLGVATEFVVDWPGSTEADFVPSGRSDQLPFDREAWSEIIKDRPELWSKIAEDVLQTYYKYAEEKEDRKKNS